MGSALVMMTSSFGFSDVLGAPHISLDPSRIAAQVISGIGFLGAGTIIFQREIIKGLTTAASVWAVAAIGLAVGGGLYLAAITATLLGLGILAGLKPVETRFFVHRRPCIIILLVDRRTASLLAIEHAVEGAGVRLERVLIQPEYAPQQDRMELMVGGVPHESLTALVDSLRSVPGVHQISLSRRAGHTERLAS
jgi:putative Mg2+ transporter-C (MgtC) family protein